ncbi:hypothetical protein F3I62_02270 [Pseudomonas sp. R-28-1W-6]|uniref:hypothetical protein n=1 Tax=Pseudomonas sp. R-28-1W-6 TaxID=2650101 RepID=UPI0013664A07|nr:hypothetical protein [Pseudomonas sp. R-28-1W-6]MWV10908.1 hypothetical protein [Pseudomonas sp. R-28-1W-6]
MHANPFDTPAATAQAQPAAKAPSLPYAFMGLAALIGLLGLVINLLNVWLLQDEQIFASYLEYLPQILASFVEATLLSAVAALLLTRSYLERHAIAGFKRPRQLLALYFGMALALSLAAGLFGGQLLAHLLAWAYEWFESPTLAQLLVSEPINLLLFALDTLLPLWLCLHLLRRNAEPGKAQAIARGEPALAFALCFAVFYLKLLSLLPEQVFFYDNTWVYGLLLLVGLPYGALVFAAAWSGLPLQLRQCNPGRLILASLLCLLLWLLAFVLVAVAIALYTLNGNELFSEALLALPGLGLLALLWPLTRLSLRWVYRPQAV